MRTVVVKMLPLMRAMTRGLFRGVWTDTGLHQDRIMVNCATAIVPFLIHSTLVAMVGGGIPDSVRRG